MPTSQPIKFLLVDDLEANLLALEQLLKREHLELLKAHSGQEALEILLAHEIALAFIDVQMPEMNGFELAELMRGTERTKSVPIIFLTAGTVDQQRRIRGYETGAIDFLPKPIDPSMLLNKANVFYDLACQRQQLQLSQIQLQEANDRLEKSNAELAHAARSKDEFLAMLAHELRNPLAPLLTGMDVLLKSPPSDDLVERIGSMMMRQVDQMAHLIDDLLDVSRITTGKIELQKTPVALAPIVEQALESVQPLIDQKEHELVVENANPDLKLEADSHRLSQVISNLLSNAAKYTPPKGKITLKVQETPDHQVRISVADNGRGIKPEHQARIFDLFEQGSSGAKEGLGLGLTLVKSLVSMHGGTVSVKSDGPDQGSEFSIVIPGVQSEPSATGTPEADPSDSATQTNAPLKVLVADDGRETANTMGLFFELEGMECVVAYDGEQAVEEAQKLCPDLVCLDLGMPKLDGYGAARLIREHCPNAYIVALSGWGSEKDRDRTKEAGFDEHMVKPVKPSDLRELMERIAEKKAQ